MSEIDVATGMDVIELWHQAWPDEPWLCASPEDVKLFTDHADSLRMFNEWKGYDG